MCQYVLSDDVAGYLKTAERSAAPAGAARYGTFVVNVLLAFFEFAEGRGYLKNIAWVGKMDFQVARRITGLPETRPSAVLQSRP
ncbi:MAG: hypothetical protein E6959_05920 [Eikenella corrodens]|nr:hypothetical protein [Eikenella corrodens]